MLRIAQFVAARPVATLVLVAVALMLPNLILGVVQLDNARVNHVWTQQFIAQLRAGVPYPRWLPGTFEGLGSPSFYAYAPLPFFLAGAVDLLSFGRLPTGHVIGIAATLLLLASGLAMRAWLQDQVGPCGATLGAIAYMAAPYHLFDHYIRGAFGEFAAYAALPLVALGLRRMTRSGATGALLSCSYALLVLAHLPSALLASVTLVPALAGWCALGLARSMGPRAAVGYLARCALAGLVGLALAAAYLLPAIAAQEMIASERLWTAYYQPARALLLAPGDWSNTTVMLFIASLAAGATILALGLLARGRRGAATTRRAEALFWAGFALGCLALLSGAVPLVWTALPVLAKVQFPWRLLTVVDLATVTALVLGLAEGWRLRGWGIAALAAAAPAVLAMVALIGASLLDPTARLAARAKAEAGLWDALEYLPRGHPLPLPEGAQDWTLEADLGAALAPLRSMPLAVAEPVGTAQVTAVADARGGLDLMVQAPEPTRIVLRRFHFPAWQVTPLPAGPALPVEAWGPDRLVSFTLPAGTGHYRARIAPLAVEAWGWALSALGALVLAWQTARAVRMRPRAAPRSRS